MQLSTFLVFSKDVLVQMLIVASSRMLIKGEPISRLLIKNSESCSTILSTKENEFSTAFLLQVKATSVSGIYNFSTGAKKSLISSFRTKLREAVRTGQTSEVDL